MTDQFCTNVIVTAYCHANPSMASSSGALQCWSSFTLLNAPITCSCRAGILVR
jgi:hypothetical protein